jgi:hypothetical protein
MHKRAIAVLRAEISAVLAGFAGIFVQNRQFMDISYVREQARHLSETRLIEMALMATRQYRFN